MIQLVIGTTTNRKTVVVDENRTVTDVISNTIDFPMGDNMHLNGVRVTDTSKTFAELGVTDRAVLLAVIKADNA